ncbi:MAG: TIGR04282 family arsenosugar biosynthesis glycosyltransferase, partial [Cyanobium sp. LacPavin_0920_WC12_MAG_62_9]|nr:TIGR04282 family arsenosugar biosynthesis glycosyltransferase [Cyanobium sp. LacPavin_0920_WC12_MAG_62_9]
MKPPLAGKPQLVVMARWPAPGRCKQRLASGLGSGRAARIQQLLTVHTLAVASHLPGVEVVVAMDGLGPRAARRWFGARGGLRWVAQGGGSLGVRMQRQINRAIREGAQAVVLIGSDLPQLERADLAAGFACLGAAAGDGCDLVLGPADDGGYWLIGLHQAQPSLLAGIPWGGDQVMGRTLERAAGLGLDVDLLPTRRDLDWPRD